MTKSNQNVHVLADETLGGIKREYVEVKRKAKIGEKVIIVDADVQDEEPYDNGDIFKVEKKSTGFLKRLGIGGNPIVGKYISALHFIMSSFSSLV